ncbi:MAG: TIGR03087 family PEP-CTERM/XrtA system glycosyltransferase [Burkholderiaceae bacterium]
MGPDATLKILFLCHRYPFPPRDGGKLRAMKMIEHLSRVHDVFVVSMIRDDEEAEHAAGLKDFCAGFEAPRVSPLGQLLRTGLAPLQARPLSFGYFRSPAVQRIVDRWTSTIGFDRIVAYSSSMGPYVSAVADVPRLLDFCDMDSEKWLMYARAQGLPKSLMFRYEYAAVARQERRLAAAFDLSTVATPTELQTLRDRCGDDRCAWFPNGVDLQYFSPLDQPCDPDLLCFVGRMDYLPNVRCVEQVCTQVLPLIREHRPQARFAIVGSRPNQIVRKLGELPGVEVTGTVPDVRPWLGRASAMLAPLDIARGTQNKVLEAMAMGVPVITSALVRQGLADEAGKELIVAESAEQIARSAVELMNDSQHRGRLSEASRAVVQRIYGWEGAMSRFESLLTDLTRRPEPVRGRHS